MLTGEAGEVEGVGRYRFCRTVQCGNAQCDRRRERCSVFVSTPRRDTDLTQSRSRFNKGHAISHNYADEQDSLENYLQFSDSKMTEP